MCLSLSSSVLVSGSGREGKPSEEAWVEGSCKVRRVVQSSTSEIVSMTHKMDSRWTLATVSNSFCTYHGTFLP
jgi:hypothetical protein